MPARYRIFRESQLVHTESTGVLTEGPAQPIALEAKERDAARVSDA